SPHNIYINKLTNSSFAPCVGGGGGFTSVVSVLAHLGDEDARSPALVLEELVGEALDAVDEVLLRVARGVDPAHQAVVELEPPKHLLEGVADLAHRAARTCGLDRQLEHVGRELAGRRLGQVCQTLLGLGLVSAREDLRLAPQRTRVALMS